MKRTELDIIAEAIDSYLDEAQIVQFPKKPREHHQNKRKTELHNIYHKTLKHAQTLSDKDLVDTIKHHENKDNGPFNENNIENATYKLQAYYHEHRRRKTEIYPELGPVKSFLDEAIIKQFPKSKEEHRDKKRNTELYNIYHKTLKHAQTLSDNDLAARVKRHEMERHKEWDVNNPARNDPDGNIPNIENAHFKLQAYAYAHRERKGQKHPELDSFTPEYVDKQLKDRY